MLQAAITIIQITILIAILAILLLRRRGIGSEIAVLLDEVRTKAERLESLIREEMRALGAEFSVQAQQTRAESASDSRALREELLVTVTGFGRQVSQGISDSRQEQAQAAGQFRESVGGQLERLASTATISNENLKTALQNRVDALVNKVAEQLSEMRSEQSQAGGLLKDSVQSAVVALGGELRETSRQLSLAVQERLAETGVKIGELTASNEQKLESVRQHVASQLMELRTQQTQSGEHLSESVQTSFGRLANDLRETNRQLNDAMQQRLADMATKVAELAAANQRSQESLRGAVEERLQKLTESNAQKLEEMRQTVDEKLHATLEKRLTDSFGLVTEQLGNVQRGLGEMRDLASGVGDLKRVLTNVKSRGGYGEVQLEMLIDQMLAPEQYVKNARVGEGTFEFAIRIPSQGDGESMLLPVDAKFPLETWQRLEDAQDHADQETIKQARDKLEGAVRLAAKEISGNYIAPPATTPFAVMFLPTEGLFAEVVRRAGLVDELQSKFRVVVAGPTTLTAILISFQMGLRTLAIQKKGGEVWKVLGAVKLEFEKFGMLMDRVEKNIGTVQNTLRDVGTRTRVINKTLKNVETADLKAGEAQSLLGLPGAEGPDGNGRGLTSPVSSDP
jgi:DNA recombination protein RmuC